MTTTISTWARCWPNCWSQRGCTVEFVTPSAKVAEWTDNTLEQRLIQSRLMGLGVRLHLSHAPVRIGAGGATLACTYTGAPREVEGDAVVMVTSRLAVDGLWQALKARQPDWAAAGIASIEAIGDADAPAPIAWATYAGRRYAEELDMPDRGDALSFRREITELMGGVEAHIARHHAARSKRCTRPEKRGDLVEAPPGRCRKRASALAMGCQPTRRLGNPSRNGGLQGGVG
jgi:hypothetical protein